MVAFTLLKKSDGQQHTSSKGGGGTSSAQETEGRNYTEYDVADKMKEFGWMVPAYTLAPDCK